MIDEKKLVQELGRYLARWGYAEPYSEGVRAGIRIAMDAVKEQPKTGAWIPFTFDEDEVFDCPLPDVDEEILVSDGKFIWTDTLLSDSGGYYLDNNGDLMGLAWMPLPEPYKEGEC